MHAPNRLKSIRRVVTVSIALAALLGAASACSSGGGSSAASGGTATSGGKGYNLVSSGYLTVAYTDGDLPEIAAGPNNTLIGTDGALLEGIAKKLGLKLKPVEMAFPSQVLAVKDGRADIGTTAYYTAARAKQVYYTYPFWKDTAGVYIRKDENYTGVSSLNGKTVSTVEGYVWAPYLQSAYGTGNVKLFTNIADAYTALVNGQVDAFINASGGALTPGFAKYQSQLEFKPFQPGDLKMPASVLHDTAYNYVNCGNTGLASTMNSIFKQMQSSKQWASVLTQYKIKPTADNIPAMASPQQLCG
jgi:polar amino acid transport system substrate-binding protein